MRIVRTAIRHAAHANHHKPPARKPPAKVERKPAPVAARKVPTVDRAAELARLEELRQWVRTDQAASVAAKAEEPPAEEPAPVALTQDRPTDLEEVVGQTELLTQLRIVIAGSKLRGAQVPHVLLSGPAGHGKTTLAGVIAKECGGTLQCSTGVVLQKPRHLAGLLVKMEPNTVLFIDEVHRMPLPVMEMLYEALEDRKVSLILGNGADAVASVHELPAFTCVGATTDPGRLSTPFRERFGYHGNVEPYDVDELGEIVRRAWARQDIHAGDEEPLEVAKRCKGVPRLALHLAERVLDYCAVQGDGELSVPDGLAAEALAAFGIDENGLTKTDWRILDALVNRFAGRTVGVDALAQSLDMDKTTLEREYEPPLVRAGLIQRAKSGRMALPPAYELFRKDLPAGGIVSR